MPRIRSETTVGSASVHVVERGTVMTTRTMHLEHHHDADVVLPSRRDILRRLGALGLAAASGAALTPRAGEAKGKGHGNGKGKGKGHGKGHSKGDGQSQGGDAHDVPESAVPEGNEGVGGRSGKNRGHGVGAELNLPDLPDPVVRATLAIGSRTNANTYPVTVSGSISFDQELVALMQRGRQFRLDCELWSVDDNLLDAWRATIPLAAGSINTFTATNGRSFRFTDLISQDKLDEDERDCDLGIFCSGNDTDEVVALLRLKTRRNSASPWKAAFREANHRDYYLSNQVIRVF